VLRNITIAETVDGVANRNLFGMIDIRPLVELFVTVPTEGMPTQTVMVPEGSSDDEIHTLVAAAVGIPVEVSYMQQRSDVHWDLYVRGSGGMEGSGSLDDFCSQYGIDDEAAAAINDTIDSKDEATDGKRKKAANGQVGSLCSALKKQKASIVAQKAMITSKLDAVKSCADMIKFTPPMVYDMVGILGDKDKSLALATLMKACKGASKHVDKIAIAEAVCYGHCTELQRLGHGYNEDVADTELTLEPGAAAAGYDASMLMHNHPGTSPQLLAAPAAAAAATQPRRASGSADWRRSD
jgi:hypothetical protein